MLKNLGAFCHPLEALPLSSLLLGSTKFHHRTNNQTFGHDIKNSQTIIDHFQSD